MFELFQSKKSGDFYFRLKAKNSQIILKSEGYSSKSACLNGIESVKKNAANDGRYDRKSSRGGRLIFNLKAGNGQVIGYSQRYESESGMENGIASVRHNAPNAEVRDLTR